MFFVSVRWERNGHCLNVLQRRLLCNARKCQTLVALLTLFLFLFIYYCIVLILSRLFFSIRDRGNPRGGSHAVGAKYKLNLPENSVQRGKVYYFESNINMMIKLRQK